MKAPLDKKRGVGRPRKNRYKSFLEGGDGGPKKKKEPKQLGSKNRCKRCHILGHRQSTCPLNGPRPRKRKKRAPRYPADDDASGPEPEVAAQKPEVVVTPNRHMITMPQSLQGNPIPVTRRMLAMALADEVAHAAPQVEVVVTPNRHTITMPHSLQGSPNHVTRRMLAMALADEAWQQPPPTMEDTMIAYDMVSTSKARKLTPKRRKI